MVGRKDNCKVRVLAVYRILMRGKPVTTRQILDELFRAYSITVDRKTIYSDLRAIDRVVPVRIGMGPNATISLWDVLSERE